MTIPSSSPLMTPVYFPIVEADRLRIFNYVVGDDVFSYTLGSPDILIEDGNTITHDGVGVE